MGENGWLTDKLYVMMATEIREYKSKMWGESPRNAQEKEEKKEEGEHWRDANQSWNLRFAFLPKSISLTAGRESASSNLSRSSSVLLNSIFPLLPRTTTPPALSYTPVSNPHFGR